MTLLLYNALFPILFLLYFPFFIIRLLRRGGITRDCLERYGLFSTTKKSALVALNRPVWIHAVSVGETVAAISFVRRWQERDPTRTFVLSTTTTTGHAMAEQKLPKGAVLIYCPLDFFLPVRRALTLIEPIMLVILEVEVWPNLIMSSANRGIPVVLANGRLSDRSARGYARHRWFFEKLFGTFSSICVQSEDDADRVRRIVGSDAPVTVCNSVKFDQVPDADRVDLSALLKQVFGPAERLVWVAGSTHPGEEELCLDAYLAARAEFPSLRLVLVPRHQERTPEVERLLTERGVAYRLRKPKTGAIREAGSVDVLVVNTTGELASFYGAADIVYVGKSLAGNQGGHNIIEPAIFGKPILHGPNMQNFREVAQLFASAAACVVVPTESGLADMLAHVLRDPAKRLALGSAARSVVERYRGAIDHTLDQYQALLPAPETSPGR